MRKPVLVVGAGPSGLTTAIELVRRGVAVRCVEKAAGPSTHTKALAVWPRTLEVMARMGGDVPYGLPQASLRYYSSGRVIGDLRFGARDEDIRPTCLPQPDVEAVLHAALARMGGAVSWRTELLSLTQDKDSVTAVLRTPDGVQHAEFSHVVGADGASSRVRTELGIAFDGSTHPMAFVVADIEIDGVLEPDVTHYFCSPAGILVACGLPSGRFRVFTSGPPGMTEVDLGTVQRLVDERGPGGIRLRDPDWISVFAVHARHAARTRDGRAFLVGDAAHIHSPAGGQGLNTGIADAHNLAWKLAMVWHGTAKPELLGTYESERGQVASAVVRQAVVQTRIWMLRSRALVALRDTAVRVASALRLFHRWYVPWLAGFRTVYRDRPDAGRQIAGFRVGALAPAAVRSRLAEDRYTLFVRGRRPAVSGVEVIELVGGPGMLALVRPDGYVDSVARIRDTDRVVARVGDLVTSGSDINQEADTRTRSGSR